jgi:hypothetical protein
MYMSPPRCEKRREAQLRAHLTSSCSRQHTIFLSIRFIGNIFSHLSKHDHAVDLGIRILKYSSSRSLAISPAACQRMSSHNPPCLSSRKLQARSRTRRSACIIRSLTYRHISKTWGSIRTVQALEARYRIHRWRKYERLSELDSL